MNQVYTFRPLEKSDFPMVAAWIGQPHVQQWWKEPATVEHVAKEYGACTDGDYRTRVYIAQLKDQALGVAQCYRLDDYPEETGEWGAPGFVGIDYFIGEAELVGKGHGAAMIEAFIRDVVKPLYPEAKGALADPEVTNAASIGALRKAGFTNYKIIPKGEYGTPEQLMTLTFVN